MLDFRRRSPSYLPFGRRTERRLLMLLGGAALVVLLVLQAGAPKPASQPAERAAPTRSAQIGDLARADDRSADEPAGDVDEQPLFPGVRPDYLAHVRDDTVFRAAEKDGWFHLLAVLKRSDEADLERASTGRVGHLQLDEQSAAYRGKLVTIAGVVRSAKRIAAPENAYGIEDYYQLWLQPERSGDELVVVYTLEVPRDFPLGSELDTEGTVTGFFFKRWAYQAQEAILTAPLILAKTIDWVPPAAPPAQQPAGESLAFSLAAAIVLALVVLGALLARGRRAPSPAHDRAGVSLDRMGTDLRGDEHGPV